MGLCGDALGELEKIVWVVALFGGLKRWEEGAIVGEEIIGDVEHGEASVAIGRREWQHGEKDGLGPGKVGGRIRLIVPRGGKQEPELGSPTEKSAGRQRFRGDGTAKRIAPDDHGKCVISM